MKEYKPMPYAVAPHATNEDCEAIRKATTADTVGIRWAISDPSNRQGVAVVPREAFNSLMDALLGSYKGTRVLHDSMLKTADGNGETELVFIVLRRIP